MYEYGVICEQYKNRYIYCMIIDMFSPQNAYVFRYYSLHLCVFKYIHFFNYIFLSCKTPILWMLAALVFFFGKEIKNIYEKKQLILRLIKITM